jgi:proteic killer suppression protein
VIKTFRHKGLQQFFAAGSKAGIQPEHATKLARQLKTLDTVRTAKEMDIPGWRLHALSGELEGHWSIRVSGNWGITFTFAGQDAILVDYQDYH